MGNYLLERKFILTSVLLRELVQTASNNSLYFQLLLRRLNISEPCGVRELTRICPLLFKNRELDPRRWLSSRQPENKNLRGKHSP